MIHNGMIYIQDLTGGGVDSNGEPIHAGHGWGEPFPCAISTNSDNRMWRYQDGVFRKASFTVLVEGYALPEMSHIRIVRRCEELGEFDVLSVERLTSVGRTKIIV